MKYFLEIFFFAAGYNLATLVPAKWRLYAIWPAVIIMPFMMLTEHTPYFIWVMAVVFPLIGIFAYAVRQKLKGS